MTRSKATPAAEPANLAQPDPDAGKGGSYVRDPKTGARTLTHRTRDQAAPQQNKEK